MIKQPGQQRVISIVKDDKAGIHRLIAVLARDNGAGMTAQARLGLDQGHIMIRAQHQGRAHAGNAPTDYGNLLARVGSFFKGHGALIFGDIRGDTDGGPKWMNISCE